jgi:hypothetical protein
LVPEPPIPSEREPSDELPAEVRALIQKHVGSFEELEVLVFLYARRGEEWTLDALSRETRVGREGLEPALAKLQAAQFVESRQRAYAYPPRPAAAAAAVGWLASARETHRLPILKWMTECAIERMRSSALSAFADAFRFRGRPRG